MKNQRARRIWRILVFILAGSLMLCIAAAGTSALVNRGLPTRSQTIDRLDDLDKARLAEVNHLRRELGDQIWPGWQQLDIPVILYNESYAFLVGYQEPPPGWVDVRTGETKGGPWEAVPGDVLEGLSIYRLALPDPGVTPQAFTVRVSDRWAASMTTKEWTEIKLVQTMREELPPPLAPVFPYPLLVGAFNSDWHISAVLHESFHAYQGTVARARLEEAEAATVHEERYPWEDEVSRDAWQAEVDLLARALQTESDEEAVVLVGEFLAQRERRRDVQALDLALVDYERQREWLEGLAKYVELESWRQAATTSGYEPLPELSDDPDFSAYTGFESRWRQEVSQLRRAADAHDVRFYYTGWAEAVLLDRLLPGWKEQVMQEGVFLEGLLEIAVDPAGVDVELARRAIISSTLYPPR